MFTDSKSNNKSIALITKFYFVITSILIIVEMFKVSYLLGIFKPLLIPCLVVLYLYSSKNRNFRYLSSLFFALISNIFLLSVQQEFLLYGIMTFMIYRILSIITIVKLSDKMFFFPVVLATIPFLFIFSSLINLTVDSSSSSFYPTIINAFFISVFSGIALSNFVMDDSKQNSLLVISALLFMVLVFLFMFQKYYMQNVVFQPLSALIFSCAHYTFYKFVIEAENTKQQ